MHWLTLGIIALSLIISARSYPRFAFFLLAILIAGAIVLVTLSSGERARGRALISMDAIDISHVDAKAGYAGSFDLSGRATNRSVDATVIELTLEISLLDCVGENASQSDTDLKSRCAEMGSVTRRVTTDVPPGQSRDFQVNIALPQSERRGQSIWTVVPNQAWGRIDR
ncbi:MAG: hypothetical protein ACO3RT_02585 [Arenicellales bacterium]|jgi:hypothetical protein